VIGTVGSPEKAALAKSYGCDHVIEYRTEDFVTRVKEITNGKGVAVAYDAVGKDTFMKTLDCIAPRGMAVSFGNASGSVPPIDLAVLSSKGSLKLTRPTLMTYVHNRALLEPMAKDLFERVTQGQIKIEIKQQYPLSDAVQAHRDLEGRKTTGTTILIP
jgi:NADPH2:quinone reductase